MLREKVSRPFATLDELAALKTARRALVHVQRKLETLRDAEEQHRIFFERTPYPRFVCDPVTLRFLAVNQAAVALYGYSREEFLRLTLRSLCPADEASSFMKYCRRARRHRVVQDHALEGTFHHLRKDGVVVDVEVGATLVKSRGEECLLILVRDVRDRRRVEQRLHVHHATTEALADAGTVAEAAPRIFKAVCESLGCDWGELWRVAPGSQAMYNVQTWSPQARPHAPLLTRACQAIYSRGEGILGRVWQTQKPIWITRIKDERRLRRREILLKAGLKSGFIFPVCLNSEVLGVIAIYSRVVRPPDKELLTMLHAICHQLGQVMGRRRVERHVLEIIEREQQRIGRDLHDGLCQQLAAIAYICDGLRAALAEKSLPQAADAARAHRLLGQAIDEARKLARGLSPVRWDSVGLMTALDELASTIRALFGVDCRFRCPRRVTVPSHDTAVHVYRIAQEAINNAITRGEASRITISLSARGEHATLSVRDNGRNLHRSNNQSDGIGIELMNHRARFIDGEFTMRSKNGSSTVAICTFPLRRTNP